MADKLIQEALKRSRKKDSIMHLRISLEGKKEIENVCKENGISISAFMLLAIENELPKWNKREWSE